MRLVLSAGHLRLCEGDLPYVDPLIIDEVPAMSGVERLDGDRVPEAVEGWLETLKVSFGQRLEGFSSVNVLKCDHDSVLSAQTRVVYYLLSMRSIAVVVKVTTVNVRNRKSMKSTYMVGLYFYPQCAVFWVYFLMPRLVVFLRFR